MNCAFATLLLDLFVSCSTVLNFHTNGLSARSKLQLLKSEVNIGAVNQAETTAFLQAQFIVPHSILALTVLTCLHMWCSNDSKFVQLDWLGQLTLCQSAISFVLCKRSVRHKLLMS